MQRETFDVERESIFKGDSGDNLGEAMPCHFDACLNVANFDLMSHIFAF
jgi:hypothetical protein